MGKIWGVDLDRYKDRDEPFWYVIGILQKSWSDIIDFVSHGNGNLPMIYLWEYIKCREYVEIYLNGIA